MEKNTAATRTWTGVGGFPDPSWYTWYSPPLPGVGVGTFNAPYMVIDEPEPNKPNPDPYTPDQRVRRRLWREQSARKKR